MHHILQVKFYVLMEDLLYNYINKFYKIIFCKKIFK